MGRMTTWELSIGMLTVKEAAFELDVSVATLYRWADEGRIASVEVGPTSRVRIPVEAVRRLKGSRDR